MLCSLWTRGRSVLLIGAFLLGNGLPWQRAADDPYAFVPEPENSFEKRSARLISAALRRSRRTPQKHTLIEGNSPARGRRTP